MSPSTTTTPSSLRRRLLALGLGGLLLGGTTGMVLAGDDEQEKRTSTKVEKIDRTALRSLADRFAENALGPHRRFTVTYASVRTLSSATADEPISSNDFNAFLPLSARSSARSPLERVSASLESAAASDDKTPFTVSSPGSRAP